MTKESEVEVERESTLLGCRDTQCEQKTTITTATTTTATAPHLRPTT